MACDCCLLTAAAAIATHSLGTWKQYSAFSLRCLLYPVSSKYVFCTLCSQCGLCYVLRKKIYQPFGWNSNGIKTIHNLRLDVFSWLQHNCDLFSWKCIFLVIFIQNRSRFRAKYREKDEREKKTSADHFIQSKCTYVCVWLYVWQKVKDDKEQKKKTNEKRLTNKTRAMPMNWRSYSVILVCHQNSGQNVKNTRCYWIDLHLCCRIYDSTIKSMLYWYWVRWS